MSNLGCSSFLYSVLYNSVLFGSVILMAFVGDHSLMLTLAIFKNNGLNFGANSDNCFDVAAIVLVAVVLLADHFIMIIMAGAGAYGVMLIIPVAVTVFFVIVSFAVEVHLLRE